MITLACAVMLVAMGYFIGTAVEWHRVLAYLHRHEDTRTPWWIAAGIAADEHRRLRP